MRRQAGTRRRGAQLVRAVARQPPRRLLRRQPALEVGAEDARHLLDIQDGRIGRCGSHPATLHDATARRLRWDKEEGRPKAPFRHGRLKPGQGAQGPSVSPWAWWAGHALAPMVSVLRLDGLPPGMWQIVTLASAVGSVGLVVVGFCSLIS